MIMLSSVSWTQRNFTAAATPTVVALGQKRFHTERTPCNKQLAILPYDIVKQNVVSLL